MRDVEEAPLDEQLCRVVISLAERQADEMALQDGAVIQLEETSSPSLPFLPPQDGFVVGILSNQCGSVRFSQGSSRTAGAVAVLPAGSRPHRQSFFHVHIFLDDFLRAAEAFRVGQLLFRCSP